MAKYSQGQIDRVLALREAGHGYPRIEKLTGVRENTARYHCLKNGAFPPGYRPKRAPSSCRRGRPVSAAEETRMIEMSREGHKPAAIGKALGRPANTVLFRLFMAAAEEETACAE